MMAALSIQWIRSIQCDYSNGLFRLLGPFFDSGTQSSDRMRFQGFTMSVGFVRPSVSELVYHFFERSVHPELFRVEQKKVIRQPNYVADVAICEFGHSVSFRVPGGTLTEAVTRQGQELPGRCRLLHRRIQGCRDETRELDSGVVYHVSYQVEKLAPDVFLTLHEELINDCHRAPISGCFSSQTRLAPAALSFIQTDVWPRSLLIHAFHTFPEDCAIVKTQSLFECQKG